MTPGIISLTGIDNFSGAGCMMEKNQFGHEFHSGERVMVQPQRTAAKISLGYALAGWLWILFSDLLLPLVTRDPDTLVRLSSVKGSLFVIVTAGILFALVYVQLQRIQASQQRLAQSARELGQAHAALTKSELKLRRQLSEIQAKTTVIEQKDREMWSLFENMHDAFADHEIILDSLGKPVDYRFLAVNPAYETLVQKSRQELLGRTALEAFPQIPHEYILECAEVALTGKSKTGTFYSAMLEKHLAVSLYCPQRGHFAFVGRDVSEEIDHAQKVERLAYFDQLTGLPNRARTIELLNREIDAGSGKEPSGALLYIDMDDLKLVNDSYGHSYGDSMIITAAMHLVSLAPIDSTVARVGGDEFVVLLPGMNDPLRVEALVTEIVDTLGREYEVRELQIHASASIGIALYPQDGKTVEELLRNADTALNEAKRFGKHCWRFFHKTMQETAYGNMLLINGLQNALTNQELHLYFQPQLSLKNGEAIAFEALLRWHSSRHGDVSPARFIPLAERSRLIESIGAWTLKEAAGFSRKLSELGHPEVRVAVNVSPRQLMARNFLQVVRDAFEEWELTAGRLEIEITENVFIESVEECVGTLNELRKMGVHLSLDDFGTGYSSLTYLRSLPVQTVKIDKTFIDLITTDPTRLALLASIIDMAHVLGLAVVAEGVETLEQMDRLIACRCDTIQGYLVRRPAPDADALTVLDEEIWRERLGTSVEP